MLIWATFQWELTEQKHSHRHSLKNVSQRYTDWSESWGDIKVGQSFFTKGHTEEWRMLKRLGFLWEKWLLFRHKTIVGLMLFTFASNTCCDWRGNVLPTWKRVWESSLRHQRPCTEEAFSLKSFRVPWIVTASVCVFCCLSVIQPLLWGVNNATVLPLLL